MNNKINELIQAIDKLFSLYTRIIYESGEPLGSLTLSKGEFMVILFLGKIKKAKMIEITNELNFSKANTTAIVNKLFKKKLVIREFEENDRRVIYISLTEKGNEVVKIRNQDLINYANNHFVKSLSEEEIDCFLDIVKKIK